MACYFANAQVALHSGARVYVSKLRLFFSNSSKPNKLSDYSAVIKKCCACTVASTVLQYVLFI